MSPREQGSVLRQPLETGSSQVMGQWEQTVAGDRQTSLRLVGLLRESIGYPFTWSLRPRLVTRYKTGGESKLHGDSRAKKAQVWWSYCGKLRKKRTSSNNMPVSHGSGTFSRPEPVMRSQSGPSSYFYRVEQSSDDCPVARCYVSGEEAACAVWENPPAPHSGGSHLLHWRAASRWDSPEVILGNN